ncbi:hypothetical protein XELAEV_18019899mg [Xenopus laevis]|uniref:Uncharacterized protein n=1 Tax=Xenopus laevis TaxID=8355 RepID=A0A974D8P3_XENLA|nr:hypothetical protein XELAEV_18019899mg [Xenopus laevis]
MKLGFFFFFCNRYQYCLIMGFQLFSLFMLVCPLFVCSRTGRSSALGPTHNSRPREAGNCSSTPAYYVLAYILSIESEHLSVLYISRFLFAGKFLMSFSDTMYNALKGK